MAKSLSISPAILNSDTAVKVQQSFTPTLNTVADYEIAFPVALAVPDDVNRILQSTPFTINGSTCVIRNKLSSTTLEIFDATNGTVIFDNIGNYNQTTGKVSISGFGGTVTGFSGSAIKISVTPANQNTIKPLRNYIIKLDTGKTSAAGTIDFQNTATTLTI